MANLFTGASLFHRPEATTRFMFGRVARGSIGVAATGAIHQWRIFQQSPAASTCRTNICATSTNSAAATAAAAFLVGYGIPGQEAGVTGLIVTAAFRRLTTKRFADGVL